MTGGVAKNVGAVEVLNRLLDTTLLVPSDPQIIGALGAARLALLRLNGAQSEPTPVPAATPNELTADCQSCVPIA
jgi:hypothetical protein